MKPYYSPSHVVQEKARRDKELAEAQAGSGKFLGIVSGCKDFVFCLSSVYVFFLGSSPVPAMGRPIR